MRLLSWDNSWHFATPLLVSPRNVWETVCWSKFLANQKHHPDLGCNASSVWNFCGRFSDVISQGNQWWGRETFFSRPWGYRLTKVALVPSPSGRLLWISDSPREKWNITLGKEFFDNTQRRKTLTKNVKKRIVNNWQLFLEPEWALSQGLWLGGHEGERNNCFSKIQLVGKKPSRQTTLAS